MAHSLTLHYAIHCQLIKVFYDFKCLYWFSSEETWTDGGNEGRNEGGNERGRGADLAFHKR